jgi:hypothetical protein
MNRIWLGIWGFLFGFNAYYAISEGAILNTLMAVIAALVIVIEWRRNHE